VAICILKGAAVGNEDVIAALSRQKGCAYAAFTTT
jgi:hypothetical protein